MTAANPNLTASEVRALLQELTEENPFAVRALLRILRVEFDSQVPTLAVTIEERPRLRINLAFLRRHCATPEHVKAALCHEFLHVLLRHTALDGPMTPARNVALDAAINAMIHRQLGDAYSGLFAAYYREAPGMLSLLRPRRADERCPLGPHVPAWWRAWEPLYAGKLLAEDIEQLAESLAPQQKPDGPRAQDGLAKFGARGRRPPLLGNHDEASGTRLPETVERALERMGRECKQGSVWRATAPGDASAAHALSVVRSRHVELAHWQQAALQVLRRHVVPHDGRSRTVVPVATRLPVLSVADRRAFLRATWSPFLPEARWAGTTSRPHGTTHVYLDVSGSMGTELPLVVELLGRLGRWIRRPLWAFSNDVAPAVIEGGRLKATTTGGTSVGCVLDHLASTQPAAAVLVTDGWVEQLDPRRVAQVATKTRLHAIVTHTGSCAALQSAGIPYSQLQAVPR